MVTANPKAPSSGNVTDHPRRSDRYKIAPLDELTDKVLDGHERLNKKGSPPGTVKFGKRAIFLIIAAFLTVISVYCYDQMIEVQTNIYDKTPNAGYEEQVQIGYDVTRQASYFLYISAISAAMAFTLVGCVLLASIINQD